MIFFYNASGTLIKVAPDHVYQGSDGATTLYFVAPIVSTAVINVAFTLPNGERTAKHILTPFTGELDGVTDGDGNTYKVWAYDLDGHMTAYAGNVAAQFFITISRIIRSTQAANFTVELGVPPVIEPPEGNSYDEVITYIQEVLEQFQAAINGKQDALTETQLAAVNSGIDSEKVAEIDQKVDKSQTIAGIDLQDNITKNELAEALGISHDLNIENAAGQDSIIQKYTGTVDATHFENTNTGESAAVFGEANNNTANRALLAGKLIENKGANSIVGGLRNKSYVNHSMVGGYDNTNEGDGYGSFVNGCHAINRGQCSFVNGYGEESAPLLNEGGAAWLGGDRCKIGSNGSHALVHGFHLISNYPEQKVFGKYNLNKSDTFLEIGNGTAEDARSNAFEVTKTGIARAYGTPVGNNDLIPKGFADSTYALKTDISAVYKFKGSVATYNDLPSNLTTTEAGWVYDVLDTGDNYAWTGTVWDKLAGTIDLSGYYTKTETDALLNEKLDTSTIDSSFFDSLY